MRIGAAEQGATLWLAPTDLANFHACVHRSALDLGLAAGDLAPPRWSDPDAERLAELGRAHEARYVGALEAEGRSIVDLRRPAEGGPPGPEPAPGGARSGSGRAAERTVEAMRDGAGAIVQGCLEGDLGDAAGEGGRRVAWRGYADVLVRVEVPSPAFGAWSYEAHDTKLARETAAGTILQLSVYSDLLARIQGAAPRDFHVVTPAESDPRGFLVESHRVADTAAAYRRTRRRMIEALLAGDATAAAAPPAWERLAADAYPEPVEHCAVCRWWSGCDSRRRDDDHLSFVAGIRGEQRAELESHGALTLAAAAALESPLPWTPARGSRESLERVCQQARLQERTRRAADRRVAVEWLPARPGEGLALLPEPAPGDVFLDLEGDPFARAGEGPAAGFGREYLTGLWLGAPRGATESDARIGAARGAGYRALWALDDAQERAAFEQAIDLVLARWEADPGMHVYHFGHYEPSAWKRLMSRHSTRGEALDRLLRSERFVDLHRVVRGALRAGVESYSIKALEALTGFARGVPLADAGLGLRAVQLRLEARQEIPDDLRAVVEGYNADDCRSTERLRDWLEQVRRERTAAGEAIARPVPREADPPEAIGALDAAIADVERSLLAGVPVDPAARDAGDRARWLLAQLLGFPRREQKAQWWEMYRLLELPEEDLLDEGAAVAGLCLIADLGPDKKSRLFRFGYPPQEMNLRRARSGDGLRRHSPPPAGDSVGHLVTVDRAARTLDLRVGPTRLAAMAPPPAGPGPPTALVQVDTVDPKPIQESLLELARAFAAAGGSGAWDAERLAEGRGAAGRLLFGNPRRGVASDPVARVLALDRDVLAIQGPPGAGKTWQGARMILALVAAGRRVAVTAVSHKVIRNLLDEVVKAAKATDFRVAAGGARRAARLAVRAPESGAGAEAEPAGDAPGIERLSGEADEILGRFAAGDWDVLGGTAWLWARPAARGVAHTLFVDEAGQMSLATTLAVADAARNLVLLGDPQQLDQPQKASHPDGVEVSALGHLIGTAPVLPPEMGLFLPETWRLAPPLCALTSELFYDGELAPAAGRGLERQALAGTRGLDGAGLWWCPVDHRGRASWSPEEVEAVAGLLERLLPAGAGEGGGAGPWWIDRHGERRPLGGRDILVVAPFNAQVARLEERLAGTGVRIGTVDRFQGQEAPVVLYSMASSSAADAPRGLSFLLDPNRFNVATSRARCAVVLVGAPALLDAPCRSPREMRLVNALCRFAELARRVEA